jgi:hypothetical protein
MERKSLLKVLDEEGLYKDPDSKSVINLDERSHNQHRLTKEMLKKKRHEELMKEARLNTLENDVASLRNDISQILDLLKNGR